MHNPPFISPPLADPDVPPGDSTKRPPDLTGVDLLMFRYRTDPHVVAEILPSALEVDDDVTASISFVSYRYSAVGSYLEVIQQVACRFRGQLYGYIPHIYLTSEPAMIAGREVLGYPKQLADIEFDPYRRSTDGLVSARLERPAGVPAVTAEFRASSRHQLSGQDIHRRTINLKVIPSAILGRPPAVAEFVPVASITHGGELWAGRGSLRLTGASDLTPLHLVPIVENLGATLLVGAEMTLNHPTETYPL